MITSITQFQEYWKQETEGTSKIMAVLTDASLKQAITKEHRTLGRLAWHVTMSIVEMLGRVGLNFQGINHESPVPKTAAEIKSTYDKVAANSLEQIGKNWNDATLKQTDDMYGQQWSRGMTLRILIDHEIHHRGQMTVLMRQAGLKVPGLMGPSLEECAQYGMKPPEV